MATRGNSGYAELSVLCFDTMAFLRTSIYGQTHPVLPQALRRA